ncbi:MAG: iron-containing alcohol dehydrogenase [Candidatus Omnitrophica bacterium]|nr:iron-containing alcohol dehydrogenase [Candidatus Omnitrophota bacterium]MCM8817722.1 iron-containing alcohol dehydrogenase [Candidatus Omnitrophota bacterium]
MLNRINFYLPTRVIFGSGSIKDFLPNVRYLGNKFLIATGRNFARSSGLLDFVCKIMEEANLSFQVFEGISPEPTIDDCVKVAQAGKIFGADVIIALGGGSAMDVGKAAAVLIMNPGNLRDFFGEEKFDNEPLPVIAIPTTCGSGSEVTRYAVIIDPQENTKKTVSSERIIPKLAILDPTILRTLPSALVAGTSMDALSHAIEGFLSIKANHITRMFSRESINLIKNNIIEAVTTGASEKLELVFLGSLYAGFVINHTGTIFVHGMAYGLAIKYGIHHGTANALCLPYALTFLKEHGYFHDVEEIEKILTVDTLFDIYKKIGIPIKLSDIGLGQKDIKQLAEMAVKGCERSFRNMRVTFGMNDFIEIFSRML